MNMKGKLRFMVIFTMMLFFTTMTARGQVETQTRTVSQTSDDGYVTETGILWDGPLVTILDVNMDIRSFVVFRDIEINEWERLENATLRLYSSSDQVSDTSSVTIHGIKQVEHYLPIDAPDVLSVPITTSSVVADTSFFYGGATLDIDVTNILRELMSHPEWIGDGHDGSLAGEKIGFLILGAEGNANRVFIDDSVGNGLEARIIIYWGETPPPPDPNDPLLPPGFNDTSVYTWTLENSTVPFEDDGDYNDTIDIWRVDAFGPPEFQYLSFDAGDEAYYHNSSTGIDGYFEIDKNWARSIEGGATSPILSMGPWTLIMGDPGTTWIFISDDEFLTNTSYEPNDQYNLWSFGGNIGSIAVDRQNETVVHIVYTSVTPGQPAVYNVIYTNFTLDMETGVPTFAPSYTNITQWGSTQKSPVIHIQENGSLHVVWYGNNGFNEEQVWYRRRHENGTWLTTVRVSDTDVAGDAHRYPDVVAHSETGVALVVWEFDRTDVYWDVVFPNNTDDADRLANTGVVPSMVMDRERNEGLMIWSSALGQPAVIYYQNKTIDNSTAWSANKQVSPGGEKHFHPDIGIETVNGTIQAIWYNDWNLNVAGNYWNIGDDPIVGKDTVANLQGRYNYIEEEFERSIYNTTYFVVWGNGTFISGPLEDPDDIDDLLEILFGVDPLEPDPPSQGWDPTGPFTRFGVRLYIFIIGIGLFWGPLVYMATGRPTGYQFVIGAFIMLVGVAFLIAAGSV